MAKKIRISGEIGLEVRTSAIVASLEASGEEDLEIEVASVGGDVFAGIEIFNAVLDYRRAHPAAKITVTAKGIAASMASYIMMVSAAVGGHSRAEENAVMMVHDPWNLAVGSWRDMQKNADFLKGLSDLMGKAYMKQTGKSAEAIAEIMQAETWLFGQQIKDAGFVDEMIPASDDADPKEAAAAISAAKLKFQVLRSEMDRRPAADPQRVAAAVKLVSESLAMPGDGGADSAQAENALDDALAEGNLDAALEGQPKPQAWAPGTPTDPEMMPEEDLELAAHVRDAVSRLPSVAPTSPDRKPAAPTARPAPVRERILSRPAADDWKPGQVDEI